MSDTNYILYDGKKFELKEGQVHKLTTEQFANNDSLKINLLDENLMVILIFKKINYKCIGLIGKRTIKTFTKEKLPSNELIFSLSKNTNCFPNGGFEPEYFIVTKKNTNMDDYWASMNYNPEVHENNLVEHFQNWTKK